MLKYVHMGNSLQEKEYEELDDIIHSIKDADEKEIDRMTELAVKWVTLNPEPITVENADYNK